jgi:two-component system, OmpR family, sensor histidine kinase ArlS
MNLKQSFTLLFSLLFSVLFAIALLVVYYLFADFRTEEFQDRLMEKAETTAKLLLEVDEVSTELLQIIDQNTINRLYQEQVIILNDSLELIYSTRNNASTNWTKEDLNYVKKQKKVFKRSKDNDVLGVYYDFEGRDYYVLISANDKYGIRKLEYLKYLLTGAFLVGTALAWLLSFQLSKKNLKPLDQVRIKIQEITDKNLNTRVPETKRQDEIAALSNSFNQMMDRIDTAYNRQKEFTQNASHELRTPIARMMAQLENVQQYKHLDPETRNVLKSISEDAYQLSDIVTSLLLLSEIDTKGSKKIFRKLRLDELIFTTAEQVKRFYPDFRMQFEIVNTSEKEPDVEVEGDETLLKVALLNLFKNGYIYSDNKSIRCTLKLNPRNIQVLITNTGEVPDVSDTSLLFDTFTRGSNTYNKPGSGIGLSIVQRILQYHHASMVYNKVPPNTNEVVLTFRI